MVQGQRKDADPFEVYHLGDDIYWVGFADWSAGFSNNPYLLVCGEEAVLVDPGSLLHYHVVAKKVLQIVRPEQISTIIVQHQDPDLCASIPKFEALIERPLKLVVPPRAALFMPYYAVSSELITPQDRDRLTVGGRTFEFHWTPYVHFAGAMMTWEAATRTLLASDVFAAFSTDWHLFADENYVEETRAFIEPYIGSPQAWQAALARVRELSPARICPQHGSIVDRDIETYLDAVSKFDVARMLAPGGRGGGRDLTPRLGEAPPEGPDR